MSQHRIESLEVISVLPLGGKATRLSPLPFSKAMYPVGFRKAEDGSIRPKVVCHYLLESLRLAGIRKAYLVLRPGAWDIPAYWEDGDLVDMDLGYLVVRRPDGVPYTIDQAYPFVRDAIVAFGYPDIVFSPKDGFCHLLEHLTASQADLVLGVAPVQPPQVGGDVALDETGKVKVVVERPDQHDLPYNWYIAVWTPTFTEFLHQYLQTVESSKSTAEKEMVPKSEVALGDILQGAIVAGLNLEAIVFPGGGYLDVGTPRDLITAIREFVNQDVE